MDDVGEPMGQHKSVRGKRERGAPSIVHVNRFHCAWGETWRERVKARSKSKVSVCRRGRVRKIEVE
jgi:hypothetical protein